MNAKKLTKSNDKMIFGVCAGIAEYFDLDPTIVRIAYALLSGFTMFAGVIVYIIMAIVIPQNTGRIE